MEENTTNKHVCGVCNDEWISEHEYLNHICPGTQATPQDPEHLIKSTTPDFAEISQAAQERGAESQAQAEAPEQTIQ